MSYFDDHEDDIIYGRSPGLRHEPPTCNRCGKTGLNWQHDGERWVLHEGRFKVHRCDQGNPADDFEALA